MSEAGPTGHSDVTSDTVERRLAAIVSADAVGYSLLMARNEVATVRTLNSYRDEITFIVNRLGGRVVDSPGDNILMEFPSATNAIKAAVQIQERLAELNESLPVDRKMKFRMGIHLGEVLVEGARIYGDGVNLAARLEALANPGGIWLSRSVREQVGSKLEIAYSDRGEHSLKNVTGLVHAFSIEPVDGSELSRHASAKYGARDNNARAAWIAVLPFANLGKNPEQDYFADGITEDIITGLSAYRSLRVISRTSSFRYRDSDLPLPRIAENLGVRFVLEGSVRRAGDQVRVTAQLIEAPDRHHVWADRYDGEVGDIFDVQDRIAESIVTAIDPAIRLSEVTEWPKKRPDKISAWDYVQRGLVEIAKARRKANVEAREHFSKAIEIDSGYAAGYAGLAWSYFWDGFLEWAEDPKDSLERAYGYAKQALELDALDASIYAVIAGINLWMGRVETAQSAAERATELNPSLAHGYVMLAAAVKYAGDPKRGVELFTRALELSPHDPWANWFLGGRALGHFMLENFDMAIVDASAAIKRRYGYLTARIVLIASLVEKGDLDGAQMGLEELLAIHPKVGRGVLDNFPFTSATEVNRQRLINGLIAAGLEA